MVESIASLPEVSFEYSKIIFLLFQGEGGNVRPYMKHLERLELLKRVGGRVPVEIVEIKGLSKDQSIERILGVKQSVEDEFVRTGKGTFVHCYCSGRAALFKKLLHIKYIGEKAFFPLEQWMRNLCNGQNVLVWAVFNCGRSL